MQKQLSIIIDNKIPYIYGILEPFAKITYITGSKICNKDLINCNALIIRTRTICNAELLEGTAVKFIATATIGFDHIDTEYCKSKDIFWTNAPGCNSVSVLQYISSALMYISQQYNLNLSEKTIGIIGVGNVGRKIANFCNIIGIKVLLNDPPRERLEGKTNFTNLSTIQQKADIITLHVPLNKNDTDSTFHLIDENFISNCKNDVFIINSCRGEVFDSKSIINALKNETIKGVIIDCWENEPKINRKLLELCNIGTPHIAGYSKDGKANGTSMAVQALSKFFNLGIDNWQCQNIENTKSSIINIDAKNKSDLDVIKLAIESTYNIKDDSIKLKKNIFNFENIRENYPVRREFQYYTIIGKNMSNQLINKLVNIGFKVQYN